MAGQALLGDGIIARLAFVTIVIIGFYIFLRLGLVILSFIYADNTSPHLLDGMVKSNNYLRIVQDPTVDGSIPVYRSDNENKGTEFTWSVWIYMDNVQTYAADDNDLNYHIFSKGSKELSSDDDNKYFIVNGPGLYLNAKQDTSVGQTENELHLLMDTFDTGNGGDVNRGSKDNKIVVAGIPVKKWVNVIIRIENKTIDIFINGILSRRTIYSGIIRQNYGDVYLAGKLEGQNSGAHSTSGIEDGFISNLWYYDRAIGTMEILSIVNSGPNTKYLGDDSINSSPSYLSTSWYTNSIINNS